MKTIVTVTAIALFSFGATAVQAAGCNKLCADGYTYDRNSGSCVKQTVSS